MSRWCHCYIKWGHSMHFKKPWSVITRTGEYMWQLSNGELSRPLWLMIKCIDSNITDADMCYTFSFKAGMVWWLLQVLTFLGTGISSKLKIPHQCTTHYDRAAKPGTKTSLSNWRLCYINNRFHTNIYWLCCVYFFSITLKMHMVTCTY